MLLEAKAASRATPIVTLRHVVPLEGNCRLTMPVVKRRYAPYALPHTFDIGVFRSIRNNSPTIKHTYNESANIFEDCHIAVDTNDCRNFL